MINNQKQLKFETMGIRFLPFPQLNQSNKKEAKVAVVPVGCQRPTTGRRG